MSTWRILVVLFFTGASSASAIPNPRFGIGVADPREFSLAGHEYWRMNLGWYFYWGPTHAEAFPQFSHRRQYGLVGAFLSRPLSVDEVRAYVRRFPQHYPDGKVWVIGNEIGFDDGPKSPEEYAAHYKTSYENIKAVNPTFQVLPGSLILGRGWWSYPPHDPGVDPNFWPHVQITATQYINRVNNWFLRQTGRPMPADGFSIHGYHHDGANPQVFQAEVRAFRTWMRDAGFRHLPVFMKEMGNFPPSVDIHRVAGYMDQVVSWLATATDPPIGMPGDDHRLVQQWAWFHTRPYAGHDPGNWSPSTVLWTDSRVRTVLGYKYGELAGRYLPQYRNLDGRPDVFAIKRQGSSLSTELNILKSEHGFHSFLLDTTTVLSRVGMNFEFGLGDWNRDGKTDLYALKKSGTGRGRTEVHVMDGARNYGAFLEQVATSLSEMGAEGVLRVADWNRDRVPDVWYIKKYGTPARTEVHILNGADRFQSFLLHTATRLSQTGSEAAFAVGDWNRDGIQDLWYIKKHNTGTLRTEVHILNGADNFQSFLLQVGTALAPTGAEADFDVGDFDGDGVLDLWYFKKYGTGTRRTEIHILSGRDWFQRFILHSGSSLFESGGFDQLLLAR